MIEPYRIVIDGGIDGYSRLVVYLKASTNNQRIERLWRDVNRIIVARFLNIFLYLEDQGVFDPHNELHLFALHLAYVDLINVTLKEFVGQWNNHPVTTESNLSPEQLWIRDMVSLQNSGYSAVESVVQDFTNYGIDVDGPVPQDESRMVNVPITSVNVDDSELANIINQVKLCQANGDVNGFNSFALAVDLLNAIT